MASIAEHCSGASGARKMAFLTTIGRTWNEIRHYAINLIVYILALSARPAEFGIRARPDREVLSSPDLKPFGGLVLFR
jgi:hypothetical protein